jgi:hypothetical protein
MIELQEFKILLGKTKENEVVEVKIEVGKQSHRDYPTLNFSWDRYDAKSFSESEGETQAQERLDDGEDWKMAVAGDRTTDSMEDYNEDVLSMDGWQSIIGDIYEIMNSRYVMWSSTCGIKNIDEFKELFVSKEIIELIIQMDKAYQYDTPLDTIPKELVEKLQSFKKYESSIADYENNGEDDEYEEEEE